MSDIDDFMTSYLSQQKAITEANVINKGIVFDALSKGGNSDRKCHVRRRGGQRPD